MNDRKVIEKEKEIETLRNIVILKENQLTDNKVKCEDCNIELNGYDKIKNHVLETCNKIENYMSDEDLEDEHFSEVIIECDNCDFTNLQDFILK